MLNTILIVLILLSFAGLGVVYYISATKHTEEDESLTKNIYNQQSLVDDMENTFTSMLRESVTDTNLDRAEVMRRRKAKTELRSALKNCVYGDSVARDFIKSFITEILMNKYELDDVTINNIIPFHQETRLSAQDKFEIMMLEFTKRYETKALEKLIVTYNLNKARYDESRNVYYEITKEDISTAYEEFKKEKPTLDFYEKLGVVTQRIYQMYKGYSVCDQLILDSTIDGVSAGVSGIPEGSFNPKAFKKLTMVDKSYDSVWIFFKGVQMHLSFLSFGSEKELERVCKNVYRYNNPGFLSERKGFIVSEMKSHARVVVCRPPFCESWVFFIRNFSSTESIDIHKLYHDENMGVPIETIKWLVKGCRVTGITGEQGCGKTTLLMSVIRYISPTLTLRIQELAFELHLRKTYPERNIVSFRETNEITAQMGLDIQKKTDGSVNILGEVAEAGVASLMIQMSQVASRFTLFTHHAKTAPDLVTALRNCLLQTGQFSDEKRAEEEVAKSINFDIHLTKDDVTGKRYIERISEIIPLSLETPYPDGYKQEGLTTEEKQEKFLENTDQYYFRVTDRKVFQTKDICRCVNGRHVFVNEISERAKTAILTNLSRQEDRDEFLAFCDAIKTGIETDTYYRFIDEVTD